MRECTFDRALFSENKQPCTRIRIHISYTTTLLFGDIKLPSRYKYLMGNYLDSQIRFVWKMTQPVILLTFREG